jgi:hypothetical protein
LSSGSASVSDPDSSFLTGLDLEDFVGVFDAPFEPTFLLDFVMPRAPISGSGGGVGGFESSRSINKSSSSSESGKPPIAKPFFFAGSGAGSGSGSGSGSSTFFKDFDADLLDVASFLLFLEEDSGTDSLSSFGGAGGGGGGTGGVSVESSFNFVSP